MQQNNTLAFRRVALAVAFVVVSAFGVTLRAQEKLPQPPADTTLVYLAGESGDLVSLPLEAARASIDTVAIASRDKKGYIELAGPAASTRVAQALPKLYLFVPRGPDAHPAFVVRLDPNRGRRRVPILAQKGQTGYAVPTDHIVIPHYRVLTTVGELLFMEITPRLPLVPGEYAVLGADLKRIATFSVVGSSTPQ